MKLKPFLFFCSLFVATAAFAKDYVPAPYTWTTQSENSSASMPCGGHDIGMNVWVENGDLMVYLSRSGFFDENNTLLKAGRLRLHIDGNPFASNFSQTLNLDDGAVYVKGDGTEIRLWADVKEPVVFMEINGKKAARAVLSYESWRHHDRLVTNDACQQFSWKWLNDNKHYTYADSIRPSAHGVTFEHHNRKETVFDFTVCYEHLDAVKSEIPDPIGDLSFGGRLTAPAFSYVGTTDGTYVSTDFRAWNFEAKALKKAVVSVELLCNKGALQFPSINHIP